MDNRYSGAIPSEYDKRDFTVTALLSTFPSSYMVRDVDIYDQGNIGNCVMQAIRSAPHAKYGKKFGATFGYGYWRNYGGSGMQPNVACNGFVRDGIPPESVDNKYLEMPEAKSYALANLDRMLSAAEPYKGWTWSRLYSINEIKATLMEEANRKGLRCIVCLPYYYIGMDGYWKIEEQGTSSYHEMAIVGWDDNKGWKLRNSWGSKDDNDISLGATNDGYVWLEFNDVFECNDVIALFPPETEEKERKEEDEPKVVTRRTLRLSNPYMRGDDVAECQQLLEKHGYDVGTIDGIFGNNTDKAVRAFQRGAGLAVDGIVGKNTWVALDADDEDIQPSYDIDTVEQYMKLMVGDLYIIGGQGHKATQAYLAARMQDEPAYFTNGRGEWLKGIIESAEELNRTLYAEDCSGLLMKVNEVMKFFPEKDLTANGIMGKCKKIDRSEVKPGDILFRLDSTGRATHMAWVGREGVYEAAGTAYGVVKRTGDIFDRKTLNNMTGEVDTLRAWTDYGRIR